MKEERKEDEMPEMEAGAEANKDGLYEDQGQNRWRHAGMNMTDLPV